MSCHRIDKLGNEIGPNIADTRTKTPEMLLVDILDPNAAIDANFISYIVTLKSGKVLTGLIAQETGSSITLHRADNQTDVVLRQDIESDGILSTGKSLMPEGLEKGLSNQDMADLLAFLRRWGELEKEGRQSVGWPVGTWLCRVGRVREAHQGFAKTSSFLQIMWWASKTRPTLRIILPQLLYYGFLNSACIVDWPRM